MTPPQTSNWRPLRPQKVCYNIDFSFCAPKSSFSRRARAPSACTLLLFPASLHLKPRPNALDFSLYIARQMSSIVECCREGGWPNALDFSLDLELNIPRVYFLMNDSFMECFGHYLLTSNCACVRSTTLDNFALDQTSLDKLQSSRLHSTRWPKALDISLNMHVERCIVKSRERLARA